MSTVKILLKKQFQAHSNGLTNGWFSPPSSPHPHPFFCHRAVFSRQFWRALSRSSSRLSAFDFDQSPFQFYAHSWRLVWISTHRLRYESFMSPEAEAMKNQYKMLPPSFMLFLEISSQDIEVTVIDCDAWSLPIIYIECGFNTPKPAVCQGRDWHRIWREFGKSMDLQIEGSGIMPFRVKYTPGPTTWQITIKLIKINNLSLSMNLK